MYKSPLREVLIIHLYEKGKRQNTLKEKHIQDIVETYQFRQKKDRYSRRVSMDEIEKKGYNLNISRYEAPQPNKLT